MKERPKHLSEKGFSLIELLATLMILGIIVAIAVPLIGNVIQESKDKAILAEASNIISAAKIAHANGVTGTKDDPRNSEGESADIKFLLTDLEDYVNITIPDDEVATSFAVILHDGEWSIYYPKFEQIKTKEFQIEGEITESDLNAMLLGLDP